MSASSSPQLLYRIDECGDVMADACVCGEDGDLVFLSVWARDTAIQQFLARLTLGRDEDGLDQFHLIPDQGGSVPVFVPSVERLEKRLTRSYRRTLFGSLVNLWLFDRRCIRPDKATTSALALLPRAAADPTSRLWLLVKETCPLPLLDHWQGTVLALLRDRDMLRDGPRAAAWISSGAGRASAHRSAGQPDPPGRTDRPSAPAAGDHPTVAGSGGLTHGRCV